VIRLLTRARLKYAPSSGSDMAISVRHSWLVILRRGASGLRSRSRSDARAYALKMTDEGRRMLATGERVAQRVDAIVLGALPAARRQVFLAALAVINQDRQIAERLG
jgi:hypothetical protein